MKKLIAAVAVVALLLAGCASGKDTSSQRKKDQAVVDTYSQRLSSAVPYPLAQMRDSIERRNLRERLLRFNKPAKLGYVYLMSFGKFLGYYTIRGKISSTESQMTVTDEVRDYCSSDFCGIVTDSMGDDGSYGPNEQGVFFFTTGGVMVQTNLDYVYSDAPLNVGDVPQLLR
jgi:outer membrane murein-binding lipoprotein Lpp